MNRDWRAAVIEGDILLLAQLIMAGEDVDKRDKYGQTSLMLAASRGNLEVCSLLIKNGAKLDSTAKYHLSALMLAVIGGHERIVSLLLSVGAAIDTKGCGAPGFHEMTALDLAEALHHSRIMQRLNTA